MSDDKDIPWSKIIDAVGESFSRDEHFKELVAEDIIAFRARMRQVLDKQIPFVKNAIALLSPTVEGPITQSSVEGLLKMYALWPLDAEQKSMIEALEAFLDESVHEGDLVIFVGAGMSFDSDIGWRSIDITLGNILKVPQRHIKERVFSDIQARCARLTPEQIVEFQDAVSRFIRNRNAAKPNEAHRLIAQLLAQKEPGHLICFNWDNFIEEEYMKRANIPLTMDAQDKPLRPTDWFWKPHGCITRPDLRWVLPNEHIKVPHELVQQLQEPTPRIVICFGFSGSAEFAKEHLTNWFGTATPIYDVRPGITEITALGNPLPFTAKTVLRKILERG